MQVGWPVTIFWPGAHPAQELPGGNLLTALQVGDRGFVEVTI